jgi:hypothetical protein
LIFFSFDKAVGLAEKERAAKQGYKNWHNKYFERGTKH